MPIPRGARWQLPDADRPVLLAGPTASGKSALALELALRQGRAVINADALQVYACWHILTARPDAQALRAAPHLLYGHRPCTEGYSAGQWLREVTAILHDHPRAVITGGTGLYFTALTEGLAEIPPVAPEIRAEAGSRLAERGLAAMVSELDPRSRARIDTANPARVQRAWEVLRATGRGIAAWQDDTGPPLLPEGSATRLVIEAAPGWLAERIDRRFERMVHEGALDEVRAARDWWHPDLPASRAIGARELMAYLDGACTLDAALADAKTATRRYAKRQRSWFRNRMAGWRRIAPPLGEDTPALGGGDGPRTWPM